MVYMFTGTMLFCGQVIAEIDSKNFEQEVLKSKVPVIIDFWATWCGPCRIFTPTIEDASKDYDKKIKFLKMDVDKNESVASEYSIMSIPAVLYFEKGLVKSMSVGAVPKTELKKWIDSNL
jgi:thioredoxin 1